MRTEQSVEAYRAQIDSRKPEKYGFASMAAVPYAHIVAQLLQNKHPKGAEISLAPNPKDIVSRIVSAFGVLVFILVYTDLGKPEREPCRSDTQEDDGLVPNLYHRLPEHRSALRAIHSRQLVLSVYYYFFLPDFSLSHTRRSPPLSHSSNTGLSLLEPPSPLSLVYFPLPCPHFLVSFCQS